MENDVFELSVEVDAVFPVFPTTPHEESAEQLAIQVVPAGQKPIVMNEAAVGSHAYAVVDGDMVVNGVHLTVVGDYDATVALYGGLVEGGVDVYARIVNAVENAHPHDGYGFGMS